MLRTVLRLVIRKRFDPKVQYIFISMWWFHHDLGIVSTMVCQCSHRNTQNAQSTDQRGFLKQKNQEQMCSCAICGKNSSPLKRQFKRWRTICNKYHLMRTLGAPRHSNSFKTELHKLAMKAMIKMPLCKISHHEKNQHGMKAICTDSSQITFTRDLLHCEMWVSKTLKPKGLCHFKLFVWTSKAQEQTVGSKLPKKNNLYWIQEEHKKLNMQSTVIRQQFII